MLRHLTFRGLHTISRWCRRPRSVGVFHRVLTTQSAETNNNEAGTPSKTNGNEDVGDFNYRAFEDTLFETLSEGQGVVAVSRVLRELKDAGLHRSDPRLSESMSKITRLTANVPDSGDVFLGRAALKDLLIDNIVLMRRAFVGDLVIPEFPKFCASIDELYWACRSNTGGTVSTYLPELSRQNADRWGVSLCTVDGQRHSIGDVSIPFTIQSGGRPINYALAINELGEDVVRQYVGQEPSDEALVGQVRLDITGKPQNPLVNAGAIVVASLMHMGRSLDERFEAIMNDYRRLCGGAELSFNNSMFLAERDIADHNYAIGYFLRHHKCFPAGVDLHETLDLYFQLCSTEITADSGAIMAATLANGGYCPTTGEQVLNPASVRNTLSLMHSCGMYDYSGGFAFKVGLPGKAGISGIVLLVVPNVLGVCLWSPPIDAMGNSVRGVQFCEKLVQRFNFHHYDSLRVSGSRRRLRYDPRVRGKDAHGGRTVRLLFAAASGDLTALRRMALAGHDMSAADYDGRTALHIAASEGHVTCVKFLLEKCNVPSTPCDRWGQTPLDEATYFKHSDIVQYLQNYISTQNNSNNDTVTASDNKNNDGITADSSMQHQHDADNSKQTS